MKWLIEIDGKADQRRFSDYGQMALALDADLKANRVRKAANIKMRRATTKDDAGALGPSTKEMIEAGRGIGYLVGVAAWLTAVIALWDKGGAWLFWIFLECCFPPLGVAHGLAIWLKLV